LKVAVIGGRGYIGRKLCAALQQRGIEVISISSGQHNGISIATGLFPDGFSIPAGVEGVYYLSQSPRYRQVPDESTHLVAVNCAAAIQAASAARNAGTKRFIYASTGNVYAPSFDPLVETSPLRRDNWYSLSKVMAEDALSLFRPDLIVTVARIFGVYGPGQQDKLVPNLIQKIQAKREIFVDRNANDAHDQNGLKISLTYIDDLVHALINLLSLDEGGTVNLAGPFPVSIREIVLTMSRLLGIEPIVITGARFREGNLIADTTKYMSLFPQSPFTSFNEGLPRLLESIRKGTGVENSPLP
jgi:UDP-glucose 4-epimerase